jgi:predicted MFS family arabinose efflux permease
MIMAPVARRLAKSATIAQNYGLIIAMVLFSLIGVAFRWQYFGILFVFSLWAAIVVLSYLVSYYLNALADSQRRATVLSFKGLAFNLGYGFVSLLFAVVLRAVTRSQSFCGGVRELTLVAARLASRRYCYLRIKL